MVTNASVPDTKKVNQSSKAQVQQAASTASAAVTSAPTQHRARLDVGFASFEKSMLEKIAVNLQKGADSLNWTAELQSKCKDNVTQELSKGLKSQLAELKQSIGKTWMALPEDDQKNAYVDQLKSAFEPNFQDAVNTIDSHLQRSLKHLQTVSHFSKKKSGDQLLEQCETTLVGNILDERCYELTGEQHMKKAKSFLQMQERESLVREHEEAETLVRGILQMQGATEHNGKFCMPSVFEAMLRRLHDSQGLIGMTMQFEAKSAALQPNPGAIDSIVSAASGKDSK